MTITLEKNAPQTVDLTKLAPIVVANLNWQPTQQPQATQVPLPGFWNKLLGRTRTEWTSAPVLADLDLGCLYEYRDPVSGETQRGVIQALGELFGGADVLPYIYLDQDDRSGRSEAGETLTILAPEVLTRVLIFAYIYPSSGLRDFKELQAEVRLQIEGEPELLVKLDNPTPGLSFCAVALLEKERGELKITKTELYSRSHREADQAFNWGLEWVTASK